MTARHPLLMPRTMNAKKPPSCLSSANEETQETVRVASIQCSSDLGDATGNTAKLCRLCEEAAADGAKIIVLPETAITGYLLQDLKTNWVMPGRDNMYQKAMDPADFAETCPGKSTQYFSALAKRLSVYITVPFLEVADDEVFEEDDDTKEKALPQKIRRYYNTVCLVTPTGKLVAHYRKLSPWPTPEQSWASAGSDVVTFDTKYGRVGLAICFDIHSVLAKYARHHLWALLYPIAWVGDPQKWFSVTLPSLLKQVNCPHYIFGANWSTDKMQRWDGAGFTTHWGPLGEILGSTDKTTGDAVVFSTIFTEKHMPGKMEGGGALDLDKYAE